MKIDEGGEHMAKGKDPAELPEYGTVMMKGGTVLPHPDYRCRRKSGDLRADTRRIVWPGGKMPQKKIAEVVSARESRPWKEVLQKMVADAVWNGKN